MTGLALDQDAIPRLAAWSQAPANSRLQVTRVKITGIKLALHGGIEMPNLDAVVTLGKGGGWQKLSVRDGKANLEFIPLKEKGQYRATFSARAWTPPVGPKVEFADLAATASITGDQMVITGIEGRVFEGALKGAVTVQWKTNLTAEGDLSLKGADLTSALAGFTRDFNASGILETAFKFSAQGQTPSELFAAPRVNGNFTLQKGVLNNIDLVRGIQSTSRSGLRGGKTPYTEIAGDVQSAAGRISYRNLRLTAGPLNATGVLDVLPNSELTGRLNVQLGTQSISIARGTLNIGGDMKGSAARPVIAVLR